MVKSPCPTCTLLSLHPKDPVKKRTARVAQLLRQNHPPSDIELADFRVVVDGSPGIIQDLDEKIAQARKTLDHLIQARKQAESHLTDAKSLLHPIRRLPNEILSDIFFHCVPNRYSSVPVCTLDPRTAPWTLTAVSRRWRDITLSLPQLWTLITFNFEKHREYTTPHQTVYKTTLFLERSKCYPLFVYLIGRNQDLAADPAFAVLEVSIPRWRLLSIAVPSLSAFSHGNSFSSLEHLIIFSANSNLSVNLDLFEAAKAPSLRVVETRGGVSWCRFKHLSLPWPQLTTIHDFSVFDEDGINLLEKATSLAHLGVDLKHGRQMVFSGTAHLPKVVRLTIWPPADVDASALKDLFKSLDMPSLIDLSLCVPSVDSAHFFPHLIGASQKLITLRISCNLFQHPDNTSNLLLFLSCTPCVQDFLLMSSRLTIAFFAGLTLTSSLRRLPRLRILDITRCYCAVASIITVKAAIYEMLRSRSMINEGVGSSTDTRGLERVRVPRWLFFSKDQRWADICGAITVECGITKKDGHDYIFY